MNGRSALMPGRVCQPIPPQNSGEVDATTPIEITVVLLRRASLPAASKAAAISGAALAAQSGADPADIELVGTTVTQAGAQVIQRDPASWRVRISGTAPILEFLFGTTLQGAGITDPDGNTLDVRHRTGDLSVPAGPAGVVTGVLGLDDRPQARVRLRAAAAATRTSDTPLELARVFGIPAGADGTRQSLASIELGGGFAKADLGRLTPVEFEMIHHSTPQTATAA